MAIVRGHSLHGAVRLGDVLETRSLGATLVFQGCLELARCHRRRGGGLISYLVRRVSGRLFRLCMVHVVHCTYACVDSCVRTIPNPVGCWDPSA